MQHKEIFEGLKLKKYLDTKQYTIYPIVTAFLFVLHS